MGAKMCCLALVSCCLFLFCNCEEVDVVNPQVADEDASARRSGPVANAGPDATVLLPIDSTTLDGSLSKVFDNYITYQWTKIYGPDVYVIKKPFSDKTLVTNLVEGTYTFRLTVTDSKKRTAMDEVMVVVNSTVTSSPSTPTTSNIYFYGNMDNVSISTVNSKMVFDGWDPLDAHPYIENFELNNVGGVAYAFQEIKTEPLNASKNSMHAVILNDDPNVSGTTRAQMSIRFNDGVDLPVYHTSHRMYLNPDVAYLKNYSSAISWFDIFEIWNKRVEAWDGSVSGSARWSLYINKDSGAGQPLYWVMKSEYMQPANLELDNIWKYSNKQIPIPLGQWVTLDIYMKRGDGTNGKLVIKMTPDGGSTQVLFDISNSTIYPGHPEIQLKSWQPFKLYLDDVLLDWMSANGKKVSAFYNDFTWFKN
jgi:hypothetical protein